MKCIVVLTFGPRRTRNYSSLFDAQRGIYLHKPPPGRNDWHVRFTPPAIDGVRREIFRSTGTKEIGAAKRIAADIIKSFWIDGGRSAVRLKLRDDNATIGELMAKYRQCAAQRPGTIRSNVRSLRMVIKTVHGGDPDSSVIHENQAKLRLVLDLVG